MALTVVATSFLKVLKVLNFSATKDIRACTIKCSIQWHKISVTKFSAHRLRNGSHGVFT